MTTSSKTRTYATLSAVLTALLVGATILACGGAQDETQPGGSTPDTPDTATTTPSLILAFSGGGYHALSGGAAWLMGMMERTGEPSLASVTANVHAIGSNSGGSWLMTLASYSPTFLSQLETPGEYQRFAVTGYMGQVWSYISGKTGGCKNMPTPEQVLLCDGLYEIMKSKVGSGFANFLVSGSGQWQTVIENSVFGKASGWAYYSDVEHATLASQRNSWVDGKDLVLAGTFLTREPALTYTSKVLGLFKDVQTLQGSAPDPSVGGVPVMLAAKEAVDPLPGGTLDLTYGTWKVKDLKEGEFVPGSASADKTTLGNSEVSTALASLPVVNAAAISSAAGGGFVDVAIMASELKGWVDGKDTATALNGFAPAYQMHDAGQPAMNFYSNVHDAFVAGKDKAAATTNLAQNKVVRYADGGFVDNTAVAQMLRYLQDANNGTIPSGFSIVAFDDLPAPRSYWFPETSSDPFPTGGDVAALFGFGSCDKTSCSMQQGDVHDVGLMGLAYTGPAVRVFPCDQYFSDGCAGGTPVDRLFWSPNADEKVNCSISGQDVEQPLLYSRYEVTVDASAPGSELFGIDPKNDQVAGTLHVFAILGADAAVVPGNDDQFACYNTLVTGMVDNLKATGGGQCDPTEPRSDSNPCTLGDYLENALGL